MTNAARKIRQRWEKRAREIKAGHRREPIEALAKVARRRIDEIARHLIWLQQSQEILGGEEAE